MNKILSFILYGGIYDTASTIALVMSIAILKDIEITLTLIILVFSINHISYSYNHIRESKNDTLSNPKRTNYYKGSILQIIFLIILFISLLIILLYINNFILTLFSLLFIIGGILYTEKLKHITVQITGFKNLYTAFFFGLFIVVISAFGNKFDIIEDIMIFIFIFLRILLNTIYFDIKDVDSDRNEGLQTFPVKYGKKHTMLLLHILNLFSSFPIVIGVFLELLTNNYLVLLPSIIYGTFYLSTTKSIKSGDIANFSYIYADGEYFVWLVLALLTLL